MKSAEPGEAGREPERNVEKEPVIRILVAAHKRTYAPENRLIRLVQAGTALAGERLPGMLHDDEGDHISRRNRTYCELTVQYYAWKNVQADYYGFFHYRRYMSFAKEYPVAAGMRGGRKGMCGGRTDLCGGETNLCSGKKDLCGSRAGLCVGTNLSSGKTDLRGGKTDLCGRQPDGRDLYGKRQPDGRGLYGKRQPDGRGLYGKRQPVRPYVEADSLRGDLSGYALEEAQIRAVVEKYDVLTVLPERMDVTVRQQFCQFHNRADLERMVRILKKRRPEYAAACDRYMDSKYIYFCNMYIMRREYFQAYMEWLFPLLEEFEAGKGFHGCGAGQARITGYLAERLFGVYYTWLREQGEARCCELQYVIFHSNVRRFQLWENGPQIAVDMKKINRLIPPGSLRRRVVRTAARRRLCGR